MLINGSPVTRGRVYIRSLTMLGEGFTIRPTPKRKKGQSDWTLLPLGRWTGLEGPFRVLGVVGDNKFERPGRVTGEQRRCRRRRDRVLGQNGHPGPDAPELCSYAMMRAILLACCVLVTCTGCPEPPMASRVVSLSLPAATSGSVVSVPVTSTELQAALKTINDALVSQGFVRDASPDEAGVEGFVASYSRRDAQGYVPLGGHPLIWFKSGQLDIVFADGRVASGRVTAATRQAADSLAAELRSHYGKERVKVGRGPA
jgi:hypothetical protein